MAKYQAKPLVVDAQQYSLQNRVQGLVQEVKSLFGKLHPAQPGAVPVTGSGAIVIDGDIHIVENDDWILTYADGSKEVLSNEQFTKKFAAVPAAPVTTATVATAPAPASPAAPATSATTATPASPAATQTAPAPTTTTAAAPVTAGK